MSRRSAVVAIGGNSLIKDKTHQSVRDQYVAAGETCWHIASMIKDGWDVAIGHGNGPQVGFILRRSELASHELHEVPLDVCGADSQGAIGYALAQNLENDFRRLGIDRHAVCVVTQMEVAADDPAFSSPTKPIGSFMDEPQAVRRRDEEGWDVAIGHGNGPQVGFILRRSELAAHELHEVPLDVCGADSQGAIGYALAQNLENDFRRLGMDRHAVAVVTQVEVAADDPAFQHPTKPIGSFMDEPVAMRRKEEDGWAVVDDANRGWRRVVASPQPLRIVEEDAVKRLLDEGFVVVTVGGGGIPVVADADGNLAGVAAVIDKDLASSLLASRIDADLLMITTAVEKVALDFGTPEERPIDRMSLAEAKEYLAEGKHFAAGSMAPKIQAVIGFLERGGERAVITDPENVERALRGETGTTIVRE